MCSGQLLSSGLSCMAGEEGCGDVERVSSYTEVRLFDRLGVN